MFSLGRSKGYRPQARLQRAQALDPRAHGGRRQRRTPAVKNPPPPGLILGHGLLKRALGMAAFMALSGALLLGGYLALSGGPWFQVREAHVTGVNYLSRMEVLAAAGIGAHTNLLGLSVSKARQGICDLPWVHKASVERRLPHTVLIRIEERRPAWVVVAEGGLFYLDAQMRPFAPARTDLEMNLPVISGLAAADMVKPDEQAEELLDLARRLLASLPEGIAAELGGLGEIHLDRVWGLSVVFNNLPPTVRLGHGGFEARWARMAKVVEDLRARGELARATLIDLDAERRAVVRLGREAA